MFARPSSVSTTRKLDGKVLWVSDCGLYVPHDLNKPAAVYVVIGTGANMALGSSQAEIVAAALLNQDVVNRPLSPIQAGVASGIAAGVVAGIVAAENGRYWILPDQPVTPQLKHLVIKSEPAS